MNIRRPRVKYLFWYLFSNVTLEELRSEPEIISKLGIKKKNQPCQYLKRDPEDQQGCFSKVLSRMPCHIFNKAMSFQFLILISSKYA